MATTKVSSLAALTSPDGAEELLINDGGTSKKITITNATASKLPLAGGTMTGNISHASHFTLDVGGNITLDADNGFLKFADGGTDIAQFAKGSNSNLEIKSLVSDADIVFQGNDGGSAITAMTIDMSAGGNVGIGDTTPESKLKVYSNALTSLKLDMDGVGVPVAQIYSRSGVFDSDILQIYSDRTSSSAFNFLKVKGDVDGTEFTPFIIRGDGNVGIGVTPETWTDNVALQIGGTGALGCPSSTSAGQWLEISQNHYYNSGAKRISQDEASSYLQTAGKHIFRVVDSGNADAAISWTTAMTINNNGTVTIDQDTDNGALIIDSEASSQWSATINAKYGINCQQDISGGRAAYFYRNISEAGSNSLVQIVDDHTSNTQPALGIQQDGAGYGLHIDQNGNQKAIYIDTESTTENGMTFDASALTTGSIVNFYSNSASTSTRNLIEIKNDNAAATGTTALYVKQDSTGAAAVFDGGNVGIGVTPESWFANQTALQIGGTGATLSSDIGAAYYSNNAYRDAAGDWKRIGSGYATRNMLYNGGHYFAVTGTSTADSEISWTTAVTIDNASDLWVNAGNVVIGTAGKGIDFSAQTATSATGAASTSEVLDHYEEGTWTPTWTGATVTSGSATYTRIGRVVYASAIFNATGAGTSGDCGGLPYASSIDGADGGGSGYHSQDTVVWNALKISTSSFRFYTGSTQKQLTGSNSTRVFLTYHV